MASKGEVSALCVEEIYDQFQEAVQLMSRNAHSIEEQSLSPEENDEDITYIVSRAMAIHRAVGALDLAWTVLKPAVENPDIRLHPDVTEIILNAIRQARNILNT